MSKRAYTVLIISQKAAQVKKLILSPLILKIAGISLAVVIMISGYFIFKYGNYIRKIEEIHRLRVETRTQQAEIRSFVGKITVLEEQLNRLKEMEKQVERDLREISELKKTKKVIPLVDKKKLSYAPKEDRMTRPRVDGEEVSVLDQARPKMITRLHQDLWELRREASDQEQNMKEIQEFLQGQKSILLAIPSLWPVWGRISSPFGDTRPSPSSSGGTRPHKGIDIAAPPGTPILAPADGVVTFAGAELEYGRLISLDHGQGITTMYGHMQRMVVQTGDKVKRGEMIGYVGHAGNSTGPHLHYEVRIQGNPVDPFRYLNQTS